MVWSKRFEHRMVVDKDNRFVCFAKKREPEKKEGFVINYDFPELNGGFKYYGKIINL